MGTGCIFNLWGNCSKISGESYNPFEATRLHLAARFKGAEFWYMNNISIKLLFKKLSYEKLCFGEWSQEFKKSLIIIPLGWSCGRATKHLLSMYRIPCQAPEAPATKNNGSHCWSPFYMSVRGILWAAFPYRATKQPAEYSCFSLSFFIFDI